LYTCVKLRGEDPALNDKKAPGKGHKREEQEGCCVLKKGRARKITGALHNGLPRRGMIPSETSQHTLNPARKRSWYINVEKRKNIEGEFWICQFGRGDYRDSGGYKSPVEKERLLQESTKS